MKDLHFVNGSVNNLHQDADMEGYCNFTYASFVQDGVRRLRAVACSEELRAAHALFRQNKHEAKHEVKKN